MPVKERFGPTRRGGPVFRWLGEPLAIDLANTVMVVSRQGEGALSGNADDVDLLSTPADLRRWLTAEDERLGGFDVDTEGDLGAIRALRDVVRELLAAAAEGRELPASAVGLLNEASAASPVAPQLALPAGGEMTADGHRPSAGPPVRDLSVAGLLAALARSAIELLTETPAAELRVCRAPSCGMFYLGTRRWCCSACGNRARAARHYRRHRAAPRRGTVAARLPHAAER